MIGGVALAAYGHPRLTLDLDVVTDGAGKRPSSPSCPRRGFATLRTSSGYSNHRHEDRRRGRVDFMYVGGDTARRVFAGVRRLPGPGHRLIAVPRPEHLIAMKVQAVRESPERGWQDMADSATWSPSTGRSRRSARLLAKSGMEDRWRELERYLRSSRRSTSTSRSGPARMTCACSEPCAPQTPSWLELSTRNSDALRAELGPSPSPRRIARPHTFTWSPAITPAGNRRPSRRNLRTPRR